MDSIFKDPAFKAGYNLAMKDVLSMVDRYRVVSAEACATSLTHASEEDQSRMKLITDLTQNTAALIFKTVEDGVKRCQERAN